MEEFWKRLTSLLKEKGISQNNFVEDCNISIDTFNKWKRKGTYPRVEHILTMADTLNVSIEYLLTGDETIIPAVKYIEKFPELKKIVNKLGLYPENIPAVQGYLEGRIDSQRKHKE